MMIGVWRLVVSAEAPAWLIDDTAEERLLAADTTALRDDAAEERADAMADEVAAASGAGPGVAMGVMAARVRGAVGVLERAE